MVELSPIRAGHVFWFDSGKIDEDTPTAPTKSKQQPPRPHGQEEAELHPWIVISTDEFHSYEKMVLAVPCTSVAQYVAAYDVEVNPGAIRRLPHNSKPLSEKKPCQVAKARKVRHFSIDRIVDVVGIVENEDLITRIRLKVASAIGV